MQSTLKIPIPSDSLIGKTNIMIFKCCLKLIFCKGKTTTDHVWKIQPLPLLPCPLEKSAIIYLMHKRNYYQKTKQKNCYLTLVPPIKKNEGISQLRATTKV